MLDLLQANARLPPDQRDVLDAVHTSSHRLLHIADNILDYCRLEADKLKLETTTFNLRDLIEAVMQATQPTARRKGLDLRLELDPALHLPVRGDPVRLRQLLANLIHNSVKFTMCGTVAVAVNQLSENAQQHLMRCEVRDTGIGIDTDMQSRLFKPFSRAGMSTTARLYVGAGLGLAICKRIVDLKGGRIGMDSKAGHGSTFWFEIPLLKTINSQALLGA
jgi:signal transduction histidine kinase